MRGLQAGWEWVLLEAVAAIALAAGMISAIGTRALIPLLRQAGVAAAPNERSLHKAPTPHGGGIAPVAAIVLVWLALALSGWMSPPRYSIPLAALVLAGVSWLDDRAGIAPVARLVVQVLAVGASLSVCPPEGPVFQGLLALPVDRVATAILWVWFVNLFNFMDGADGLAGSEAASIGFGLLLIGTIGVAWNWPVASIGAAVAAAALGFLASNWAPARVFLGDVGSVPLGFLIGYLLLEFAAAGWWKAALILPLYFLADATITLARRGLRGEKVWQAHREHFYQRAVLAGLSHAAMVRRVIAANLVLIGCAWAAENGSGIPALAAAFLTVAILLVVMSRAGYTGGK